MNPRLALVPDTVVVLVFVTLGRLSHEKPWDLALWAHAAWPFLIGLALGYIAARGLRLHPVGLRAALTCWAMTMVAGMLLRHFAEGEGTPVAFVLVAGSVLGLGFAAWRLPLHRWAPRRPSRS